MGIRIKERNCKSIGRAKGFSGCGTMTMYRTYGLCNDCYKIWLKSTEEGQEILYKQAMKYVAETRKDKKAKKQARKVGLMSADQYRKTYIQPKFNKIIRMIDFDSGCIATGNYQGQMHAGHYHSVGSSRTLALNAHNVFNQSAHSNNWKGGDDKNYQEGLKNTFGSDYLDFIDSLTQHQPIKLNKAFYKTLNKKLIDYKKTVEEYKRTPLERIGERNRLNEYLGIYKNEFSIFNYSK